MMHGQKNIKKAKLCFRAFCVIVAIKNIYFALFH